jgi:hypothetical protein
LDRLQNCKPFEWIAPAFSWIVWRPWSKLKSRDALRSKVRAGRNEIEFQSLPLTCRSREQVLAGPDKINSVDKLFERALTLFGPNECLGTRKAHRVFRVQQSDDVVLTKLDLVINVGPIYSKSLQPYIFYKEII